MKKVCIFSAQYLPTVGGVERYTYNIAKQLQKKGIDVTIVTSRISKLKEFEIENGIKIYRLPCYNLMNGRFPTVKFNGEYRKLMRMLKKQKYDLVITNTRFYIHSLVGVTLLLNMVRHICLYIMRYWIKWSGFLNMELPGL